MAIPASAVPYQFKEGWKGGGRKPGSKARIIFQKKFLDDLAEVWKEKGIGCLRILAVEQPDKLCALAASLMPKQVEMDIDTPLAEMTDEELAAALQSVRQLRADAIAGVAVDDTAPAMKTVSPPPDADTR